MGEIPYNGDGDIHRGGARTPVVALDGLADGVRFIGCSGEVYHEALAGGTCGGDDVEDIDAGVAVVRMRVQAPLLWLNVNEPYMNEYGKCGKVEPRMDPIRMMNATARFPSCGLLGL